MAPSRKTPTDFCDIGCYCFMSMKVFLFWAVFLCHRHSTLISQGREDLQKLSALPWLLCMLPFVRFFTVLSYFTASATVLIIIYLQPFLTWHSFPIFWRTFYSDEGRTTPFRTFFSSHSALFLWVPHGLEILILMF